MEISTLYIAIGIITLLNILVSVFIAKRDDLESFQKKSQIFIVWLVPVVAALGLWLLNRSHDIKANKKRTFGGGSTEKHNINYGAGGD
jgi:hypothetical protein